MILAASAAELAGAIVTAAAARRGAVEPLRPIQNPLDVVCQQLIGMACGGEWASDEAYACSASRRRWPISPGADFDACLAFLAGELAAPPGAYEPEPGSTPRWTSPRIWKRGGLFGIKNGRVIRWFWSNIGTITSEESIRVQLDGQVIGTLEGAYAERLQAGDRFVLDGRAFEFRRIEELVVHVEATGEEANLPSGRATGKGSRPSWPATWPGSGSRPHGSSAMARHFPLLAGRSARPRPRRGGRPRSSPRCARPGQRGRDAACALGRRIPDETGSEFTYAFHAPLGRPACEAIGRAMAARLGRRFGRDLNLVIADLGWSITLPDGQQVPAADLRPLRTGDGFEATSSKGSTAGSCSRAASVTWPRRP